MDHPNSRRFWRLNEIAGLRMSNPGLRAFLACDPEAHNAALVDQIDLQQLLAREEAVKKRFLRMRNRIT